jgi:hypothetical protein
MTEDLEPNASQEEQAADEALSQAAAEVRDKPEGYVEPDEPALDAEPGTEQEVEPETDDDLSVEPEDNAVRSQLGRKVKAMEEQLGNIGPAIDRLNLFLDSQGTGEPEVEPEVEPEDDGEALIFTKKEVREEFSRLKAEEQKRTDNYAGSYEAELLAQSSKFGDDQATFDQIWAEIEANYTPQVSDTPKQDAEMAYLRAKNAVLIKQVAQPLDKESPLKGKEPVGPLGAGLNGKVQANEVKRPKLDKAAEKYLEDSDLTKEEIDAALAGEDIPSASSA